MEAVRSGNLLFLSGMLPSQGGRVLETGRVGAELDVEQGRNAARVAALNAPTVAQAHLESLDKITRVVGVGIFVVTRGDVRDHPRVADGALDLLQEFFGAEMKSCRSVFGIASLPLGAPVDLDVIFEIDG